ncbi:HAD hydrolase-like protein [Candidatus Woesearchaeota archaeon]|jgi:FMN phosphatase YigB (HAD superfamily)|nr:HAD hydrolase-like protein [Candidatus Woesearchaeota archaeon]MBT4110606.1 HAD hydrolase-like protein [Candidatus Woesearchaeota archaeon]MBT4335870.1 HAD hydrolase-like protein [Candidatus Woesearchaeota archaeon]MBT4469151.1 HAD hydrolase-like protein [Candidatus Woesearchaeota archaeon]MBT6744530.1 HAD hydrolase-like protein [Candidatus Woesearchaeota archaeon]
MKSRLIIFDLDDTLYLCSNVVKPDYSNLNEIKPFLGVREFLINDDSKKILVTKGNKEIQEEKINILGIKNFFDEIFYPLEDKNKINCFRKIMQKYPSYHFLVVGNKITSEIRYGKELGLKTVLLNQGKYKTLKAKDDFEVPDHKIEEFTELNEVLKCKQ